MKQRNNWFDYVNIAFMILLSCVTLYPFLYLVFLSVSSDYAINSGAVKLYPIGINFEAYRMVFQSDELLTAYYNSIRYTVIGTLVFVLVTTIVAYPLSIKRFKINKAVSIYYVLTMFVNGGLIPTYLLYKSLGLVNSMWVMVLPGALSVYYLMIFKTYFQTMGTELIEAAYIDGANDRKILFRILYPLSKPIIATLSLFMIVSIWNNFFIPLLYLQDTHLQPLTLLMRKLLIQLDITTLQESMLRDLLEGQTREQISIQAFRAASIIVTIFPIICIYPFIQRYFVKGIMIGSLKA